MESLKYDLKWFVQNPSRVDLEAFIPIFHRWIQTRALDDVLIDVADYRHVHHGPGVMLLAHDAHYAIDLSDGRLGLLYSRRRETHPSRSTTQGVTARLTSVLRCALTACQLLESESALHDRLRFWGDEFFLQINDRLLAPNTPETFENFRVQLEPVLKSLYLHDTVKVEHIDDPASPLTLSMKATHAPNVTTLLKRLDESAME